MKLWLLSQEENNDWDTYDSCVVAAETYQEAINISPDGDQINWENIKKCNEWAFNKNAVKCEYLGEAAPGIEPGVICASFNAG